MTIAATRRMTGITGHSLMFRHLIDMAIKRPHRPVSKCTGDQPYHKQAFEHRASIHNNQGISEKGTTHNHRNCPGNSRN